MNAEEQDTIRCRQLMAASIQRAIAAAEQQLADATAAQGTETATLAARGIGVVRWAPPGPHAPVCPHCRQIGRFYQLTATGQVVCRCQIPD
ncbi:MAG TPA: hypothetical protein VKY74_07370 [Chloroflexia bacterium]|nr:hypothetical protein [Chloroflexia bacterium]